MDEGGAKGHHVRRIMMRLLIRAAFVVFSLGAMGVADSQTVQYRAPPQNYDQNNWMAGGGG
jgi:hypothetical protein